MSKCNCHDKYLKYKNKYSQLLFEQHNLLNYWIASSHNTVLLKHQVYLPCRDGCFNTDEQVIDSKCLFTSFLYDFGGGCLELDFGSIKNNEILIWHNNNNIPGLEFIAKGSIDVTLTSILQDIKNFIDTKKDLIKGPIILSIDNKGIKNINNLQLFWKSLKSVFINDSYFVNVGDNLNLENTKGKIMFRAEECNYINTDKCYILQKNNSFLGSHIQISENNYAIPTIAKPLFNFSKNNNDNRLKFTSISFNNWKNKSLTEMINTTKSEFIRVYPRSLLLTSDNFNFIDVLTSGVQLVAINYQYHDIYFHCYREVFRNKKKEFNGKYEFNGFRLKPKLDVRLKKTVRYSIEFNDKTIKKIQLWNSYNDTSYEVLMKDNQFNISHSNINPILYIIFISIDNNSLYTAIELEYGNISKTITKYLEINKNSLNNFIKEINNECVYKQKYANIFAKINYIFI